MNWMRSGKERLWPKQGFVLPFAWKDWGIPLKSSVSIVAVAGRRHSNKTSSEYVQGVTSGHTCPVIPWWIRILFYIYCYFVVWKNCLHVACKIQSREAIWRTGFLLMLTALRSSHKGSFRRFYYSWTEVWICVTSFDKIAEGVLLLWYWMVRYWRNKGFS